VIRKAIGILGVALIVAAIVWYTFLYFAIHTGPEGRTVDWLGREIVPAPLILRWLEIDEWRGLGTFFFDAVTFLGSIALGTIMAAFGFRNRTTRAGS